MDYNKKYESVMDRLQCLIANAKKQGHIIIRIEDIENAITELQESEDDKIRDEIVRFIQMEVENEIVGNKWLAWFKKQREKKSSDELLKIRQEVYQSGYNDGYKHGCEDTKKQREEEHQVYEKKHKFIIGDIISNNNVTYRVDNIVKNCIGQDCYFLVNVEREKDGTRYLKLIDSKGKSHNSGEITWICEQVDAKFEKKCEQNPIKSFKVGNWVVNKFGDSWHIDSFDKKNYKVSDGKGNYSYFPIAKQDEMHLWTIEDAKDGDVLFHSDSASKGIFIFKELLKYEFSEKVICYCDYDSEDHFCLGEHHTCCWADAKILHPATKKQRDLLFKKMKEAGYDWDAEKKFISSTKPNDENTASIWGDVDEYMLNETIQHLEILIRMEKNGVDCYSQYYQRDIDWLKSLKERLQPQWKPSEEQLNALDEIYKTHSANSVCRRIIFNLLEQLKKL